MIDWKNCEDIKRVSGRVSGQWTIVGTRILASCVTENADDSTPEELDEMFPGLGVERARRIIRYAQQHARHPSAA